MSLRMSFGMYKSTYPLVPDGPEAIKLSSLPLGLKLNWVMVELDVKLNTLFSWFAKAKLTTFVASFRVVLFSKNAFIR